MKKLLVVLSLVIVVTIIILLVVVMNLTSASTSPTPMSRMATTWENNNEKSIAYNSFGSLEIKAALVAPKEMLFFYTLHSAKKGTLQVEGWSNLTLNTGDILPSQKLIVTNLQSLGQIATYDVGVIHLNWFDRVGQIISLQIFFSEDSTEKWVVSPLKQNFSDINIYNGNLLLFSAAPSNILISDYVNMVGGSSNNIGGLKIALAGPSPIFLQVDRHLANVAVISQSENAKIAKN